MFLVSFNERFLWIVLKVATNPSARSEVPLHVQFQSIVFQSAKCLVKHSSCVPLNNPSVPFSYFQSVQTHVGLEVSCPPLISCWMSAVGRRSSLIRFHVEKHSTRVSRETCAISFSKQNSWSDSQTCTIFAEVSFYVFLGQEGNARIFR
jgi:hypothetical protein